MKKVLEERVRQILGNVPDKDKAKKIINLIEKVLATQREEFRDMVEGMKVKSENSHFYKFAKIIDNAKSMKDFEVAYNQALQDISKALDARMLTSKGTSEGEEI